MKNDFIKMLQGALVLQRVQTDDDKKSMAKIKKQSTQVVIDNVDGDNNVKVLARNLFH